MSTFLSYASADCKVAEKLKDELGKAGVKVWSDIDSATGQEQRDRIEEAIRSASEILVLIGPKNGEDPGQQFTWRVALEAVWQDPRKRLIPILLRGADLPAFVLSGSSGKPKVIRVEDPRDMRSAAQAILDLIHGHRRRTAQKGVKIISVSEDGGRGDRLSEIADYVQQLVTAPSNRGD
jgi:hypothetical protein